MKKTPLSVITSILANLLRIASVFFIYFVQLLSFAIGRTYGTPINIDVDHTSPLYYVGWLIIASFLIYLYFFVRLIINKNTPLWMLFLPSLPFFAATVIPTFWGRASPFYMLEICVSLTPTLFLISQSFGQKQPLIWKKVIWFLIPYLYLGALILKTNIIARFF